MGGAGKYGRENKLKSLLHEIKCGSVLVWKASIKLLSAFVILSLSKDDIFQTDALPKMLLPALIRVISYLQ